VACHAISKFAYSLTIHCLDFQNTQGIIFRCRFQRSRTYSEAREELHRMLGEDDLRDALLLVFANKQDLPNAMNASEITDKLGLQSLRQRTWYIQVSMTCVFICRHTHSSLNGQAACATSGDGLYEGLEWLSANIKRRINCFLASCGYVSFLVYTYHDPSRSRKACTLNVVSSLRVLCFCSSSLRALLLLASSPYIGVFHCGVPSISSHLFTGYALRLLIFRATPMLEILQAT